MKQSEFSRFFGVYTVSVEMTVPKSGARETSPISTGFIDWILIPICQILVKPHTDLSHTRLDISSMLDGFMQDRNTSALPSIHGKVDKTVLSQVNSTLTREYCPRGVSLETGQAIRTGVYRKSPASPFVFFQNFRETTAYKSRMDTSESANLPCRRRTTRRIRQTRSSQTLGTRHDWNHHPTRVRSSQASFVVGRGSNAPFPTILEVAILRRSHPWGCDGEPHRTDNEGRRS